jgi:hypothetical protein
VRKPMVRVRKPMVRVRKPMVRVRKPMGSREKPGCKRENLSPNLSTSHCFWKQHSVCREPFVATTRTVHGHLRTGPVVRAIRVRTRATSPHRRSRWEDDTAVGAKADDNDAATNARSCRTLAGAARRGPCRPNVSHAKLCGRGPRAEPRAARRLPRMTFGEPSRDLQPP